MSPAKPIRRRSRIGVVVGEGMMKTVVVAVEWRQRHPIYQKAVRRITRFKAHDAQGVCHQGDLVRIVECRPVSRTKHWRVTEVLKEAERLELRPEEVGVSQVEEVMAHRRATAPSAEGAPQVEEGVAGAIEPEAGPSQEAGQ